MFKNIFKKQEREYLHAKHLLKKINNLSSKYEAFSDKDLQKQTEVFRSRYKKGESLNSLLPEVFAVSREATFRILKKRPYDVQMIGGIILNDGNVAEMKTGEGKTITSIAPIYLNALSGENVLVSTVNEYLAERDSREMGEVFQFLGLTVGLNKAKLSSEEKRMAYACDITYSIHSEIGFDYLRDNMVSSMDEKVQRGFNYILIDEVDSILIDEARTPLIISGGQPIPQQLYMVVDAFSKSLLKEDVEIDLESKAIFLQESGVKKAETFFKLQHLYDLKNSELVSKIQNAIKARFVMEKNVDYIVKEDKILLVDQFTGRIMDGRSYSEGLQQAIQAKEGAKIEPETQTKATITYQNLFRMFKKLSGMSGTAKTEEREFIKIYNIRVIVVPTNEPIIRIDKPDYVFASASAKWNAIVKEISDRYKKGQPVLVGTTAVDRSEIISKKLKENNIPHKILNAKNHEKEAEIIAKAGEKNSITIATNMAGRGTDIKLGKGVIELGGLCVIGTEKNDSRRVDNQLKGRSGRQGDIGESRFFISLEDELILRFSAAKKLQETFKSFEDKPIKSKALSKAISRAQIRIEHLNYDARKYVLEYDDVIRQQRELMYAQRDIIISSSDFEKIAERFIISATKEFLSMDAFKDNIEKKFSIEKMVHSVNQVWFNESPHALILDEMKHLSDDEIIDKVIEQAKKQYQIVKENTIKVLGEDGFQNEQRTIIITTFDNNWVKHIDQLDKKRSSASLAVYAQQNPLQVYVEESNILFKDLLSRIAHNSCRILLIDRYKFAAQEKEKAEKLNADIKLNDLNSDKTPKPESTKDSKPTVKKKTITKKSTSPKPKKVVKKASANSKLKKTTTPKKKVSK